jgi:hypothetical protein
MVDEQITPSLDTARRENTKIQIYRRVLDPVDRASEILVGLIMVLTFTVSLNAAEAGRSDVRAMLVGALVCSLAWRIIDAVMFLMGIKGERGLAERAVQTVREVQTINAAHEIIAQALPSIVLPALSAADLERIRLHLLHVSDDVLEPRLNRRIISAHSVSSHWSSFAPSRRGPVHLSAGCRFGAEDFQRSRDRDAVSDWTAVAGSSVDVIGLISDRAAPERLPNITVIKPERILPIREYVPRVR